MRLDGSMSVKKRSKVVDRFNDPTVCHLLATLLLHFCFCHLLHEHNFEKLLTIFSVILVQWSCSDVIVVETFSF